MGQSLCPVEIINCNLDLLNTFAKKDLVFAMCMREVRKLDGGSTL